MHRRSRHAQHGWGQIKMSAIVLLLRSWVLFYVYRRPIFICIKQGPSAWQGLNFNPLFSISWRWCYRVHHNASARESEIQARVVIEVHVFLQFMHFFLIVWLEITCNEQRLWIIILDLEWMEKQVDPTTLVWALIMNQYIIDGQWILRLRK